MQDKKRPSLYNYISTNDEAQPIPESERDHLDAPTGLAIDEKFRQLAGRLDRLIDSQERIVEGIAALTSLIRKRA